jgi:hypothetical protein
MEIQINNISISFSSGKMDSIYVYFSGQNEENKTHITGDTVLTPEEYLTNMDVIDLTKLVKERMKEESTQ